MSSEYFKDSANQPTTGGAGTGATGAGTTRDDAAGSTGLARSSSSSSGPTTTGGGTSATGAATGLAAQAQQYGQKVADAATQAKDYVADRATAVSTVVSDKFKELQNKDFTQVAEDAKEYARQKPGQALLISAAAGFVIGLLLRSSKRR